jgi:hypothetical protein
VAGHLLALEHLAGVLTLTGRAVRAVADRHTVRGAQTAEVVPLHRTGKALTDRGARHVDELTFEVVVGGDFLAHVDQVLGVDAELRDLALGRHLGRGEMAAHRLGVAWPWPTRAQLNGRIAVLVGRALRHDLQACRVAGRSPAPACRLP